MIEIKDNNGNLIVEVSPSKDSVRKCELMKEDYILLKFSLAEPIYFPLGSYATTELGTFKVLSVQEPTYNNKTGGYDYELKMDAYYYGWKNKILKYTPEDSSTETSFSLTAHLGVHANLIIRNLSKIGYDFSYSIDGSVGNYAKVMTYNNINILDAMFSLASLWECDCWITDNIIHFGRCEYGDYVDFTLGNNVEEISRSESRSTHATRIYAFGGTKNIPSNYRPNEFYINGVFEKHLMLPKGTPYIDARSNLKGDEIIESVVVFDDIYPKAIFGISDVSVYEVEVEDDETVEGGDGENIEGGDDTDAGDGGIESGVGEGNTDVGSGTNKKTEKFYRFKMGIIFRKDYIIEGKELHIVFQKGLLNGMDFSVIFNPENEPEELEDGTINEKAQLWEIVANNDYGRKLPDTSLKPENGDSVVLYGFDSTKIEGMKIIETAENNLLKEANKYIAKTKIDPSTYTCTMFSDYIYNNGEPLYFEIGDRVNVIGAVNGEGIRKSRIIGYELHLDYPYDSPKYIIGESSAYSRISDIEGKIDTISMNGQIYTGVSGSGVYLITTFDNTKPTNRNVFSALRSDKRFIRKDRDDRTDYGLEIAKLLSLITGSASPDFTTGFTGTGFELRKNEESGRWRLEVDELLVRVMAIFFEIVIHRLRHVGGSIILTPASMQCVKVEDVGSAYRCYFKKEEGDKTIVQEFVVGDQARCQAFNLEAIDGGGVGTQFYWRLVTGVGDDWIELSKTDCASGSGIPRVGDDIVQMGNRTDETRQNAILLDSSGSDAPSIKQYKGINSYSLTDDLIISKFSANGNYIKGKFVSETTGTGLDDELKGVIDQMKDIKYDVDTVKSQTDKEFTIWFYNEDPTLDNLPASDWDTDELKLEHVEDIYYNRDAGHAWRFKQTNDGNFEWQDITDQDTLRALERASKAQDTADSKRRNFVEQPRDDQAYDIGDTWSNATWGSKYYNDLLVCITSKAAGEKFSIYHWKASNYATYSRLQQLEDEILSVVADNKNTADIAIEEARNKALAAQEAANNAQKAADNAQSDADKANTQSQSNATAILQTQDYISELAGKFTFDENGNVVNIRKSGLLLEDRAAELYSTVEETNALGERVTLAEAKVETSVQYDKDTGEITSNVKIKGNKISLEGYTTINGGFSVDEDGNVDAKAGKIAGFSISGNGLVNEGFDNDAYVVFRNDTNKCFAGIGGNVLPASTGLRAVARFENHDEGDMWGLGANYAMIASARGSRENIAINMDGGSVCGFAMRNKIIGSSITSITLGRMDYNVIALNENACTLSLPVMQLYDDGHVIRIKRLGDGALKIALSSCYTYAGYGIRYSKPILIYDQDSVLTGNDTYEIPGIASAMELVWVRDVSRVVSGTTYFGAWVQYKLPRDW